jgi:inner membrane protein
LHVPTHILSGWAVGNLLPLGRRERLLCMIASTAPDVDGLGIIFGQKAYWDYHHILGHNLLFTSLISGLLAAVSSAGKRVLGFVAYAALGHLHLVMDYFGSGPGWPICYWWPFRHDPAGCWMNPNAWAFDGWQNQVAGLSMIAAAVVIGFVARRTPLELLMPKLDRKLVGRGAVADKATG